MVLASSCNIKRCLVNLFVSILSAARKNHCNASLSGNQSAQPPSRGYSSEGDSGGTLSEGQWISLRSFCCCCKLFPELDNRCHISCLNCCHWAEERQQKRFEGMDIEELGSKDTQGEINSKKHGSYGIVTRS